MPFRKGQVALMGLSLSCHDGVVQDAVAISNETEVPHVRFPFPCGLQF